MPPGLGMSFSPLTPFVFQLTAALILWWPGGTLTETVFVPLGPLNVNLLLKMVTKLTWTRSVTVLLAASGKPSKKKVTELQVNLALTVGPVGSAPTDPSACAPPAMTVIAAARAIKLSGHRPPLDVSTRISLPRIPWR